MTTNILSIGTSTPSKQSLLGSAEISADGIVTPADADASEAPFLPMFLQMLFVQSQIKPVPETVDGTIAVAAEATEEGTVENAADSPTPVSILAGSIDGLTRLTVERTQPAMEALRSQLSQIQRPREGEDATIILPSLFGKNMRMPVVNVQEVIRAVSHGFDPLNLGTANDLVAKEHSSITLDAEEMKKQTAQELINSLMQSNENLSAVTADQSMLNNAVVQNVHSSGQIELDTDQQQRREGKFNPTLNAVPNSENGSAVEPELMKRPDRTLSGEGTRVENRQDQPAGRTASLTALNGIMDEAASIVSSRGADRLSSTNIPIMTSAPSEQTDDQSPKTPSPELAAVIARPQRAEVRPIKSERPEKTEKRSGNARTFSDQTAAAETHPARAEEKAVVPSTTSEFDTEERPASDESRLVTEKQPQPLKQDAQEFRRAVTEAESVAVKAPSGLNEVRRSEHIPSEAIKSETVRSMMEQLSKGVAVAVNENRSEMKLILHPEALGEVTVRVQVEEGKVTAKLDVQQVQTKNTIEANIPQLREALTSRGLTMERIEISTAQNGLADGTAKNHQQKQGKRSAREFELQDEEQDAVKMYGYNTVEFTV